MTPVAGKFNHAIWEPYCANESDLPEYVENEEFDKKAYREFIDRNVRMPQNSTCCEEILKLIEF